MTFYDNTEDQMEVGDLVAVGEGKWLDRNSGYIIDEDGFTYDSNGQLVDEGYYDDDDERSD